jgi:hypothetical protein
MYTGHLLECVYLNGIEGGTIDISRLIAIYMVLFPFYPFRLSGGSWLAIR